MSKSSIHGGHRLSLLCFASISRFPYKLRLPSGLFFPSEPDLLLQGLTTCGAIQRLAHLLEGYTSAVDVARAEALRSTDPPCQGSLPGQGAEEPQQPDNSCSAPSSVPPSLSNSAFVSGLLRGAAVHALGSSTYLLKHALLTGVMTTTAAARRLLSSAAGKERRGYKRKKREGEEEGEGDHDGKGAVSRDEKDTMYASLPALEVRTVL